MLCVKILLIYIIKRLGVVSFTTKTRRFRDCADSPALSILGDIFSSITGSFISNEQWEWKITHKTACFLQIYLLWERTRREKKRK